MDYNPRLIKSDISPSVTEYYWTIPSDVAAGQSYRIRVGATNGQASDVTDYFQIIGKNIPLVQTLAVQDVTSGSAILEGKIKEEENGLYVPCHSIWQTLWGIWGCTSWFEWGETSALGNNTPQLAVSWEFNRKIYVFSPNTTYYYRAVVGCNDGINYGEIESFTTKSASVTFTPTVYTLPAKKITAEGTALCGQIGNYKQAESYTRDEIEWWFEWGETISLGNKTNSGFVIFKKPDDLGYSYYDTRPPIILEDPLYGLSPDTTYYFRVVAKNGVGISYGEIESFTTKSQE